MAQGPELYVYRRFFGVVLEGSAADCIAAAAVIRRYARICWYTWHPGSRLNDFCTNGLGAFSSGTAALALNRWILTGSSTDIVIISAVMPLVPGVIFTTAVRDTLNGDYSSGAARMLEAIGDGAGGGGRSGCQHGAVPPADRRRRNR
ncbi:MAG: threonine/serine exporter family protein [Enterocloster sp.]